jgi:hypothetical protein
MQHPRPLNVSPCPADAHAGPAVFVQRCHGGSRRLWMMVTFVGMMAASGVTATVSDDDIISLGGGKAEMAIYPTTSSTRQS